MGFEYKQIQVPEQLKKRRWILKTIAAVAIAIMLSVAAYALAIRFVLPSRVKCQGQFLVFEDERLFLLGAELDGKPFPVDEKTPDVPSRVRPSPIAPPQTEMEQFLDESAFMFELKCKQLISSGGNLLNWELHLPFNPDLILNPTHMRGIRSLLDIAEKNSIFVVLSLVESRQLRDYARNGLYYTDIDRFVSRVLSPLIETLQGHRGLLAYSPLDQADQLLDYDHDLEEICTNVTMLEGESRYEKGSDGLTIRMVQYLVAKVAEAVHTIDPEELVTVTSSSLVGVKPVGHPGFFSDWCLEKACLACDLSKATVDFYMPASFGAKSRNSMPSVPFMTSFDKPIILAFDPSDEFELQPRDIGALPKTLADIGFSGFYIPIDEPLSLADDLRVNDLTSILDIENSEDVEILDGDVRIVVKAEPRDDVEGEFEPIILRESEPEDGAEGEFEPIIVVKAEPRNDVEEEFEPVVVVEEEPEPVIVRVDGNLWGEIEAVEGEPKIIDEIYEIDPGVEDKNEYNPLLQENDVISAINEVYKDGSGDSSGDNDEETKIDEDLKGLWLQLFRRRMALKLRRVRGTMLQPEVAAMVQREVATILQCELATKIANYILAHFGFPEEMENSIEDKHFKELSLTLIEDFLHFFKDLARQNDALEDDEKKTRDTGLYVAFDDEAKTLLEGLFGMDGKENRRYIFGEVVLEKDAGENREEQEKPKFYLLFDGEAMTFLEGLLLSRYK